METRLPDASDPGNSFSRPASPRVTKWLSENAKPSAERYCAAVLKTGQGRHLWICDRVSNGYQPNAVIFDQRRQQCQIAGFAHVGVRVPDDRAVTRPPLPVHQIVAIETLLVEAQDVERQTPGLEQRDNDRELAPGFDEAARRVFPLVSDYQQKTIRQSASRGR